MTKEDLDFISSMNMCDEISNEAYKKIMCHCEEQQPCEDCISREETLNKINGLIAEYIPLMLTGWTLPLNIAKTINDLPSVTPQQTSWIPCSERLPAENGNYLVTVEANDGTASIKFQMVDHYGPAWLHEEKPRKVIAWMPLPEPYNAESEGSDTE